MSDFTKAINFTLAWEGGLTNDPDDAGGITKFGLTKEDLTEYNHTDITEVEKLNSAQALSIYKELYWYKPNLNSINDDSLAIVLFDIGVNRGRPTAARMIQSIVGTHVDGLIGPLTLNAINSHDPKNAIKQLIKADVSGYLAIAQNNTTQYKFLPGWTNRALSYLDFL